ncbi:MAG: ATP synthase F1 subunit epsilon [Prevotella sp.]|nr:ATP synthase F1 subunit epsilon [Prevotella sp.]MDD7272647.1 ATP synthase F1 subunit epsilon [Prevotellaceae bacterium]MDY3935946.1 ATP synthase F1 subunit epsilon [Prevotella sp.]MDY4217452.1 ATP synthase F1 subunit epsilon [Prevotella sp.]
MLSLTIISPEKTLFKGEVESVTVPGEMGEFVILNNHAPIISTLVAGRVAYAQNNQDTTFNIKEGFVEVRKNEVNLCVEL